MREGGVDVPVRAKMSCFPLLLPRRATARRAGAHWRPNGNCAEGLSGGAAHPLPSRRRPLAGRRALHRRGQSARPPLALRRSPIRRRRLQGLYYKAHLIFDAVDELARLPLIVETVRSLLQSDEVLLWDASVPIKPPGGPMFPLHQGACCAPNP